MIFLPLISLGSLAFLIISLVKWHLLPFQDFGEMIMITQPDSMLSFFCHIWVKTTFNMRIIWWRCLLILCKGMLHVGFMSVFLRNLLLPLQNSLKYFWNSGIMMGMILNHLMLNHSLRPIWSTSFLGKNFIRKILRYLVSTWCTTPNIQKSMMIPLKTLPM